jgi:tetratricopeptide (TPR) repeat protein
MEAAHALAGPAEMRLSDGDRAAFVAALDEYLAVQRYNADRGEAHMNLALLALRRGNTLLADDHLARAIAIDPSFVPAYVQLADLYRSRRDEARAGCCSRRWRAIRSQGWRITRSACRQSPAQAEPTRRARCAASA